MASLRRHRSLLILVVVVASLLVGSHATRLVLAQTGTPMPFNNDGYCRSQGYSGGAKLFGTTAYDWYCVSANGQKSGMNSDDVCRWQYGPGATSKYLNFNDPYSWRCYVPALPVHPTGMLSMTTDRSTYQVGDSMQICYTVPAPGAVTITNNQTGRTILSGTDDGKGGCASGSVTTPTGQQCFTIAFSGVVGANPTYQTCIQVTGGTAPAQPPQPRTSPPGGVWITPSDGTTTADVVHFAAHIYPGSSPIDHVNFTAQVGGNWSIICAPNAPTSGDVYACDWNLVQQNIPEGQITVSFDVYARDGTSNLAPNGTHSITFAPPQAAKPRPSGRWITPADGTTVTDTVQLSVHAYPSNPNDPSIADVLFMENTTGTWYSACTSLQPSHDDVYTCTWNPGSALADGAQVQLGFYVDDVQSNRTSSPDGTRTVTYVAPRIPSGQPTVTTDKTQYDVGESVTVCYTLPGPGTLLIFAAAPNGERQTILWNEHASGSGPCFRPRSVATSIGQWMISLSWTISGNVSVSQDATFTVVYPIPYAVGCPDGVDLCRNSKFQIASQVDITQQAFEIDQAGNITLIELLLPGESAVGYAFPRLLEVLQHFLDNLQLAVQLAQGTEEVFASPDRYVLFNISAKDGSECLSQVVAYRNGKLFAAGTEEVIGFSACNSGEQA